MDQRFRAFASLTRANLKMHIRNPVASSSLFLALIAMLLVVKFVFSGTGPHTTVVLVDSSGSAQAAALIKDVRAIKSFDVSQTSEPTARTRLREGRADVEIVIPAGFATLDPNGQWMPVRLAVTYRAGTAGESSLPIIKGVVEAYDETALHEVPAVSVVASSLDAPTGGVIDTFLPGVVAFNIVGGGLMLAVGTFANYKSTGVLRRLKATGISPTTFVLAHATSSFLLGTAQTAAILVAAVLLFNVRLDVLMLFIVLGLAYLVFLALGLAISGWIRDPQRANAVAQSVAFPMIVVALLSAALPPEIAAFTKYLPVAALTDAMQQLSHGAGRGAVAPDMAWLLAWAIVLLAAAGRVFRWD